MNIKDFYWLAGLLEGEGSFMKGPPSKTNLPVITLTTTDEDVIAKVASFWDVKYHQVSVSRSILNNWKIPFMIVLKGHKAVVLMKKLYPIMSIRRQQQIDTALSCYSARSRKLTQTDKNLIRTLCLKGSLTQSGIAKKLGIRRETVNKINKKMSKTE
jgi:hypothetical protein